MFFSAPLLDLNCDSFFWLNILLTVLAGGIERARAFTAVCWGPVCLRRSWRKVPVLLLAQSLSLLLQIWPFPSYSINKLCGHPGRRQMREKLHQRETRDVFSRSKLFPMFYTVASWTKYIFLTQCTTNITQFYTIIKTWYKFCSVGGSWMSQLHFIWNYII